MGAIVGVFVLIAADIARVIDQITSSSNALALAGGIEALLV